MAEFLDRTGNIFLTAADTLTITVNCEGVMGAGIALEARLRWPTMFEEYASRCERGDLRPGQLMLWDPVDPATAHRVLCFPTKDRWRAPSRIEYVRQGLEALVGVHQEAGIARIAMPHLGCSHGGLRWDEVRPVVLDVLAPCEELTVEMWEFDPAAGDPWFETLEHLLDGRSGEEVRELLGITSRQVAALASAMANPKVQGLASLQQATGVGEKTLEAVYELLFRRDVDPPRQEQLPW